MPRNNRRNYEQVTTNPEESIEITGESTAIVDNGAAAAGAARRGSAQVALLDQVAQGGLLGADSQQDGDDNHGELITVVILDVAQKKFPVKLSSNSTVKTLKEKGHLIHKVPADRQRLIYQGRMLQDDKILTDEKIADQVIVHLFPKPRVLIQDSNGKSVSRDNSTLSEEESGAAAGDDEEEGGARVPTIIMNADEAQQRSQILVLGSADYLEASNNVKLFSFMLLIISSIELISLLSIALGVPQDDPNTAYHGESSDDIIPSRDDAGGVSNHTSTGGSGGLHDPVQWQTVNTFDTIISVMGVYVAIMGLKATTMNTLRLARVYLMGTFLTGIGWCLVNYVIYYQTEERFEEEKEALPDGSPPLSESDMQSQAITAMVLPGMVWMLCCLRAWQFQYLLREAEQEAEERIRSELANIAGAPTSGNGDEEQGALRADNGTMA